MSDTESTSDYTSDFEPGEIIVSADHGQIDSDAGFDSNDGYLTEPYVPIRPIDDPNLRHRSRRLTRRRRRNF